MKNLIRKIVLLFSGITIVLIMVGCGGDSGGAASNKYLGNLPGIAKEYTEEIDGLEKDKKETIDPQEYESLRLEIKQLKAEGENAIVEYLKNNPITNIPFEQHAEYPFTFQEIDVNTNKTSIHSLVLNAKIKVEKNLNLNDMREMFGGLGTQLIAYSQALDNDGNRIEKVRFVAEIAHSYTEEFVVKEGQEEEMLCTIYNLNELENFGKIIFITKEDFDKLKYKWEE